MVIDAAAMKSGRDLWTLNGGALLLNLSNNQLRDYGS